MIHMLGSICCWPKNICVAANVYQKMQVPWVYNARAAANLPSNDGLAKVWGGCDEMAISPKRFEIEKRATRQNDRHEKTLEKGGLIFLIR